MLSSDNRDWLMNEAKIEFATNVPVQCEESRAQMHKQASGQWIGPRKMTVWPGLRGRMVLLWLVS